jgi:hypothetical protein
MPVGEEDLVISLSQGYDSSEEDSDDDDEPGQKRARKSGLPLSEKILRIPKEAYVGAQLSQSKH